MFGFDDLQSLWNWFRNRRLVALPVSLAIVPVLLFALPVDKQSPGGLPLGLRPPGQEPPLSFRCETIRQEEAEVPPGTGAPPGRGPADFFFVRDQVILFGPEEQVKQTIQEASENLNVVWEGFELQLTRNCELNFSNTFLQDSQVDRAYFPFTPDQQGRLVLQLYEIHIPDQSALEETPNPVVEVIRFVSQVSADRQVFADPNYLTGMLGQNQCGSPHDPGGSPHDPGGSPFEAYATHHVSRGPGQPGADRLRGNYPLANATEFWDQWALEHVGLGPFSEYMLGAGANAPNGEGIHVAVFDTSPFTPSLEYETTINSGEPVFYDPIVKPIRWTNRSGDKETFTLKLAFSDDTRLNELQAEVPATATNVIDHGLFVAGMVHAVAPDSEVELIQVLNDYGCGDLQTLNESLFDFVAKHDEEWLGMRGIVMNLSLGINKPRSVLGLIKDNAQSKRLTGLTLEDLETLARKELHTLPAVLSVAHSRQAVVVAAAGNESSRARALPMHLPADYPFVIGVAASNVERDRACFSNWGDVAAPGGDGRPSERDPAACLPAHSSVPGDPEAALIGLAWHLPDDMALNPPPQNPPYYRHWSGTSFSAPLVSGLAALVLDESLNRTAWITADEVFEAIRCGSPPPDGVVSVPVTLSLRCLP